MANPTALHPDLAEVLGVDGNTLSPPQEQAPPATPAAEQSVANQPAAPARKYAGRYQTVEALEEAKLSSDQEAQKLAAKTRQLEDQVQALTSLMSARISPAERSASRPQFVDNLEKAGIPLDDLDAYINERVNQGVEAGFRPFTAATQAHRKMQERYPTFGKFEGDVQEYLSTHPDVQTRYDEKLTIHKERPEEALEWLFQDFLINHKAEPKHESASGAAEQAQARQDAMLPSTGTGVAQNLAPGMQQQAAVDAAYELYQAGKISKDQFLDVRFGSINPFHQAT